MFVLHSLPHIVEYTLLQLIHQCEAWREPLRTHSPYIDKGGTSDDNYCKSDSSSDSKGEDEGNQYSNGNTDISDNNSKAGMTDLCAT